MRIVKMIGFCTLEVDPQAGNIWLNAPNCVLRMQGLAFKTKREKFSMIDINGKNAVMLEGDLACSEESVFFERITNLILHKLESLDQGKEFLDFLEKQVQTFISNYKESKNVNSK